MHNSMFICATFSVVFLSGCNLVSINTDRLLEEYPECKKIELPTFHLYSADERYMACIKQSMFTKFNDAKTRYPSCSVIADIENMGFCNHKKDVFKCNEIITGEYLVGQDGKPTNESGRDMVTGFEPRWAFKSVLAAEEEYRFGVEDYLLRACKQEVEEKMQKAEQIKREKKKQKKEENSITQNSF